MSHRSTGAITERTERVLEVKCLLKGVIEPKTQFPPLIMELKILKMESLEHEKSHIILPDWTLPVIFEALNLCLLLPASKKTRVLEALTTMAREHIQVQIVGLSFKLQLM